jgi:spore coat polysaccharide biosynthesis predicted glycosyltransferase SpsG
VSPERPHVAVMCDVERPTGGPRLLRCLALAEELTSREVAVTFMCDPVEGGQAEAQLRARGLEAVPLPAGVEKLPALLDRLGAHAVVVDSPTPPSGLYDAVRQTGRGTLAIADTNRDAAAADVVVVPHVGAEEATAANPAGGSVLAGVDYALMRNDVLANRPISAPRPRGAEIPAVVALLDDARSVTALARVLVATGRPFTATFLTSVPDAADAAARVRLAPRQQIEVDEPGWKVHQQVARADLVLTTPTPATYEWLCLGSAVGLAWVDEDSVETYKRLMVRRAVRGLGAVADLADDPEAGTEKAARLLSDARERERLADVGWHLVDGLGRARVADVLLELVSRSRPGTPG